MDLRAYAISQARAKGIPEDIFLRMIGAESSWNTGAVSPKGATGLGQLMPGTAKELGVDPSDPLQNVEGSARYLKQMYDQFGSWPLALAGYNAGPGAVSKYGGIPPYAETQSYVAKITGTNGGPTGNRPSTYAPDMPQMPMAGSTMAPPEPKNPYANMSLFERGMTAAGYKQDADAAPIANIFSVLQGNRMSPEDIAARDAFMKKRGGGLMHGLLSMFGGA